MKKILLILLLICLVFISNSCMVADGLPDETFDINEIADYLDDLYIKAINDAMLAEESDIYPLVNLEENNDLCTIVDGKVLLLTFHHYPSSYIPGTYNENISYLMWTFTDKEILNWYIKNRINVDDWHLRLCQVLGLYYTSTHTHIAAVWADLADVSRPAYVTDITKPMKNYFDGESQDHIDWFNYNYDYSYNSDRLDWKNPWTGLGYTYDWADNGTSYGVSEFLIRKGSTVKVEFNYTIDEFIEYLETQRRSALYEK